MNTIKTNSYDSVLQAVRQWPPNRRFALVRDVINTLATEVFPSRPRRKTLKKALGLLATSRPVPSDTEIQRWLDGHRWKALGLALATRSQEAKTQCPYGVAIHPQSTIAGASQR